MDCSTDIIPSARMPGENPLLLDSRTPTKKVQDFLSTQTRFQDACQSKPEEDAKKLWAQAQHDAEARYRFYRYGEPEVETKRLTNVRNFHC